MRRACSPTRRGPSACAVSSSTRRTSAAVSARPLCAPCPAHVRERLPDATSVLLTVGPDNPDARRLYVAAGFVPTGKTWDHGPGGRQEALELPL